MTSKTEYAEDFIFFFYMNSNNNLTFIFSISHLFITCHIHNTSSRQS